MSNRLGVQPWSENSKGVHTQPCSLKTHTGLTITYHLNRWIGIPWPQISFWFFEKWHPRCCVISRKPTHFPKKNYWPNMAPCIISRFLAFSLRRCMARMDADESPWTFQNQIQEPQRGPANYCQCWTCIPAPTSTTAGGGLWMKAVIEEWKRLYWCGPFVRILNVVASPLLDILVCFLSRYSYLNLFILQKIYLIVPSDMFQCFKKPSFFFIVHFKNAHSSPGSIYPSCWCIESFPRSVVMLVRDVSSSILRDWKRSVLSWSPRSNRNGNVADRPEAKWAMKKGPLAFRGIYPVMWGF